MKMTERICSSGRAIAGFDGALARKLDFGEGPRPVTSTAATGRAELHLAVSPGRLVGPDKYGALEARRRAAQLRARHLLDRPDGDN